MRVSAIDAHCHADILISQDPEFETTYAQTGIGGVSWSYAHGISSWREYPAYWDRLRETCAHLRSRGLPFFYLAGIHPRCIPADLDPAPELPGELEQALRDHLNHPLCRGLGEVGLETGGRREELVLKCQLHTAVHSLPADKGIGIHTPRKDKLSVTRDVVDLIQDYPAVSAAILIDHLTPQTWSLAWERGYWLGMTLQPGKSSVGDVQSVLQDEPKVESRLMLNSDGATHLSAPFVQAVQDGDPLDEMHRRLFQTNALQFFGL